MQLSVEKVAEFQIIYEKIFGIQISKEEALERGLQLIHLLKAVFDESSVRIKK